MISTLMVAQAIISIFLILSVLLQFGKGAETGLLGASDSVMTGPQRGNLLSRITIVLSILFFANSIYLAKLQGQRLQSSLLDSTPPKAQPFERPQKDGDKKDKDAPKQKNSPEAPGVKDAPKATAPPPKASPKKEVPSSGPAQ